MIQSIRSFAAMIAAAATLSASPAFAQDPRGEIEGIVKEYLASHPDEVGRIATDYFARHPEAFRELFAAMIKKRPPNAPGAVATTPAPAAPAAPAIDTSAAIKSNAAALFASPHQMNVGNPDGDVTLVEFFDYNCGYCKHALPDMLTLLKDDPKLKIVLKEFPILGPGSVDAARVAVAVRMQDPGGQKYLAFHQELLGGAGPVTKEKALAAAKDKGLDLAQLERDVASDEVTATLREDLKLASALGINGTPSYVIDQDVVVGAVGLMALQQHIDTARATAAH